MIIWIDRLLQKILRTYRKAVFRAKIHCPHKEFSLVGKMTLINANVTLGKNVTIYPDVMIFGDGPVTIGDNVDIGNGTIIYSSKVSGGVTIGDNTMIAAQSYIIDCDHRTDLGMLMREQKQSAEPILIGSDVWIAANATILKGSNIGSGAVIGAKALVKGKIPENAVAVGIPAKILKYRS